MVYINCMVTTFLFQYIRILNVKRAKNMKWKNTVAWSYSLGLAWQPPDWHESKGYCLQPHCWAHSVPSQRWNALPQISYQPPPRPNLLKVVTVKIADMILATCPAMIRCNMEILNRVLLWTSKVKAYTKGMKISPVPWAITVPPI